MNDHNQDSDTGRLRSVMEILDEEFKTQGDHFGKIWTQEELDESRRMAERYEELLAAGHTEDQIDALLGGKTLQSTEQTPAIDRLQLDRELHECKRSQLLRIISLLGWSREVSENANNDRLIALLLDNAATPPQRYEVHCAFVQVTRNPS